MRKVSRITTQKKNASRYNIFFTENESDAYAFSVDEAVLIEFHLRKGMELDEKTIEAITQKDNLYKSYTQAIHYLSYRMRSRKEVYDYLEKKEVPVPSIQEIIDRLIEEKLLNDREFADMFVRTRINTSTKGPIVIANELREKGISNQIITEVLEQFTFELQKEKVQKLTAKKMKQSSRHSFRKRIQQMQMSLIQKGYAQDVIQAATSNLTEEKDGDEEWEALVFQGEKLYKKHAMKFEGYELQNKLKEGLHRKGFSFDLIQQFVDEITK